MQCKGSHLTPLTYIKYHIFSKKKKNSKKYHLSNLRKSVLKASGLIAPQDLSEITHCVNLRHLPPAALGNHVRCRLWN